MANPPLCVHIPGRDWHRPNDPLAVAIWLASDHMPTMIGYLRPTCPEDSLPLAAFSLSQSLSSELEQFDPRRDNQTFLSFVWCGLHRDLQRYKAAAHHLRIDVDIRGDGVRVANAGQNPALRDALDLLNGPDRQVLKFSAMGVPDGNIARLCRLQANDLYEARLRLAKASLPLLRRCPPAPLSASETREALRSRDMMRAAVIALHLGKHDEAAIAALLSLDISVVYLHIREAAEALALKRAREDFE